MSKPSRTQDATQQTTDPVAEPAQGTADSSQSLPSSDAALSPDTATNPSLKNN